MVAYEDARGCFDEEWAYVDEGWTLNGWMTSDILDVFKVNERDAHWFDVFYGGFYEAKNYMAFGIKRTKADAFAFFHQAIVNLENLLSLELG